MQNNDETTAQDFVVEIKNLGYPMSERTVLMGHKQLGWTQLLPAYTRFQ